VLRALRGQGTPLTVIVSIAYQAGNGDDVQRRITGASVEDLRRSLEALSGEERPLLRAIRRPLTIERLGRHPLGNLVIASAASAFEDYGRASVWLGEQLGIEGAVLPATREPVRWEIDPSRRLRFTGDRLDSPAAAIHAIERSQCAMLAPGSLYRSVLATAAVPDLATALSMAPSRVLWIANLAPGSDEPPNTTAMDHLRALKLNGIRVDSVLYDPSAELTRDATALERDGVEAIPRAVRSTRDPRRHDPKRLRAALGELITLPGPGSPARRRAGPA
jgi:2-phospho-L-lactate transferase/gluconeogenesis factor (CofD/UPF0052 family)